VSAPLWQPSPERRGSTRLQAFLHFVAEEYGEVCDDLPALHRWSCLEGERFWSAVWRFSPLIGDLRDSAVVENATRMPGARFYPGARLSFAENLLRREGDDDAIVFWGEDRVRRRLSHDALRDRVARLTRALAALGVGEGDRVAAFLPNIPEAIVALLATSALGAIFSSSSPDFGVEGVVDRFGQIEPKVLLCADGYFYKGRALPSLPLVASFAERLPSLEQILVVGYLDREPDLSPLAGLPCRAWLLDEVMEAQPGGAIEYRRWPFNQPLLILYSSGTTGRPKCIVHGAGGTLLKHLSEHQLHCDIRPEDRVFYFTTCGWMMWNWLVSALASEATLLLYDGNPFWPGPEVLFEFAAEERMTLFGTSASYLARLHKIGFAARSRGGLESLRTVASTGSPLAPEEFDYVYRDIKTDVCLSSISGGTDIVGIFVGGNPIGPVWRGEIQSRALGMAVDVWDDRGQPLRGRKGELVCTAPFPSLPLGFWNDPGDERLRKAYFERYPGVWRHGDFAEITDHDGVIIYGRSDATLNPGGVRIGTAEIYRQVERLPEVDEAVVIGQDWDQDVRLVLFVKLRPGLVLDADLVRKIQSEIRSGASPRHVPHIVLAVGDIPRTKSGKVVELAVREVVHGRPVVNAEALANPEALELFRDREELRH
jgi:acetoacetyl-CoA synthetase